MPFLSIFFTYLSIIVAPTGKIANLANLKCCIPKGIPMMVQHKIKPKTTCTTASSKPPKSHQSTFISKEPTPPPYSISLPKGNRLSTANLKHCIPKGMPIIVMHQKIPTKHQHNPANNPPNKNQIILPNKFITTQPFINQIIK